MKFEIIKIEESTTYNCSICCNVFTEENFKPFIKIITTEESEYINVLLNEEIKTERLVSFILICEDCFKKIKSKLNKL